MPAQIQFQPTLFLFLGTTSGKIGWRLKKLLKQAYGDVPVLRFLWLDIEAGIDALARPWFEPHERVELSGFSPSGVIRSINTHPAIKEWWPEANVPAGTLTGSGGSPKQMRLVGRLALFRMFSDSTRDVALITKLKDAIDSLVEISKIKATTAKSTENMKYRVDAGGYRIVIVHSSSGGTGGAIAFDIAYLCRHLLQGVGEDPTVISVGVLPGVFGKAIKDEAPDQYLKAQANSYAWFKEDNHLTENPRWNVTYPDNIISDLPAPPFDFRFVVDIANQAGYRLDSEDDVFNMIAQALFLDTGSSASTAKGGFTANVSVLENYFEGRRCAFSSLAAAALIYPKERLLKYCASRLARDLLVEGLQGSPDDQQVLVDAATLLARLRLRDQDLIHDLMENARVKMQLSPVITKAESVASAIAQLDNQESQNQAARLAGIEKLANTSSARLGEIKDHLDIEITRLVTTKGISFALAVLAKLAGAPSDGNVDSNELSLAGMKARVLQQSLTDAHLESARKDYEKSREALRSLDNGIEDVLERAVNLKGWKKKFLLFKSDSLTKMSKVNELTVLIAAQGKAADIYDQVASECDALRLKLIGAGETIKIAASELQRAVDQLGSETEAEALSYEFQQEIDVNFADYYWEHHVDSRAIFQDMFPANITRNLHDLLIWLDEGVKTAAIDYARQYFSKDIEETSLLSTLQTIAEKSGQDPEKLIKTHIDQLVEYCHPFWQYDRDRGLTGTEGISIIGVEDENSPLIPDFYKNNSRYTIKSTGFRDRIDVVRVQHGLPAFLLRGMNEYKRLYELRRKTGKDPLHVLPGMEFAPDVMPEQGSKNRELFALAIAFGYIVQVTTWYYFDPELNYQTHQIMPSKKFRLAQGRENAEEVFSHRDEWLHQVEDCINQRIQKIGNDAAIQELEAVIEKHKKTIARMSAKDFSLRQQYEKEVKALESLQHKLGKVG